MNQQFRVDGKVALITASARGIGRAMADSLAAAGAAVVIHDIDFELAKAEVAKLVAAGHRAIALPGDITDLTLPKRLVEETVAQLGSVDILINNGAIQAHHYWMEHELADIKRQFDADLISPILFCQQAAPLMIKKNWGRIINLGSIQQIGCNPDMFPYSLSKCALDGMTRALARDLAKHQITVNLIAPGYVNTYRNRRQFPNEEAVREKGKHIPLGRVGQPEDYGPVTVMLCSKAGDYITGQTIFIDGGMSTR